MFIHDNICIHKKKLKNSIFFPVRFDHEEKEIRSFADALSTNKIPSVKNLNTVSDMLEFLTATETEAKLCNSHTKQQRTVKTPEKPRDTLDDIKGYRYASRTLNFRTKSTRNGRFEHYTKYDESRSETIANSAATNSYTSVPDERSTVYPSIIKPVLDRRSDGRTNLTTTNPYTSVQEDRSTVYPGNIKPDLDRRSDGRAQPLPPCGQKIFLFNFEINGSNNFLVRRFEEIGRSHKKMVNDSMSAHRQKYNMLQNVSHIIKYVGVSILSLMIIEVRKLFFIFVLYQQ